MRDKVGSGIKRESRSVVDGGEWVENLAPGCGCVQSVPGPIDRWSLHACSWGALV